MNRFQFWVLGLGILLPLAMAMPARAIVIGFDPSSQSLAPGSTTDVALTISDLGDLSPPSLSTFDVDVTFDSSIIGFSSVSFGDPVLGDQLDLFGLGSITAVAPGAGLVNLFELSFDLPGDLDTLQAGAFTLATLTFDTLSNGTSPLGVTINALGDAFGDPLSASVASGSITVAAVPEPATIILFGIGLAGLGFMAGRRRAGG